MPPGQQDNNDYVLFFFLGIILLAVAMWWLGKNSPVIHGAIMRISQIELAPVARFSSEAAFVREAIEKMDPAVVTSSQAFAQLAYAGKWYAWPLTLAVAFLAWKSWTLAAADKYRRQLNMKTLLQNNRQTHAAIAPILNWPRSLLDEPPDDGPWKVARQPIQFVAEHGLFVDKNGKAVPGDLLLGMDNLADPHSPVLAGNPAVRLDREKATSVFERQFGPEFNGFHELPKYQQKLALAFLLFGAEDKRNAFVLLDSLSMSFRPYQPPKKSWVDKLHGKLRGSFAKFSKRSEKKNGGMNPNTRQPKWSLDTTHDIPPKKINELLERKDVKRIIKLHNKYSHLFILSLYEFARTKGVLPTADFIWLRPVNRDLFYLLNNFGRRTSWVEIAGPWTHYQAEILAASEIPELVDATSIDSKMVKEAVNALEIAMYEEGWIAPGDLSEDCRKNRILDD
ncbi:MAG: hypothetical protein LBD42_04510 [Desulfovibrio sp.]|jgi:hypothetical protein|nr:hypothetical protein [Desulfovibrio sp.]